MPKPIYLDYNATTPHDPEVIAAMRPFFEEEFGNPSSSHYYGAKPKQAVIKAREQVAFLLNGQPEEIIFTSGGTESNNFAIKGCAQSLHHKGNHIITSQIEHPAVLEVCHFLETEGFEITYLPVDEFGLVSAADVAAAVKKQTILISVMHANNEVGTVEPITEIAQLAKKHGIALHTDAAQSVGKIPVDVNQLGVDLLSIAGHKVYAPKGVGALFMRKGVSLEPFMHGAGQESGRRAGTENTAYYVGLGAAMELAGRMMPRESSRQQSLRDRLYEGLKAQSSESVLAGDLEQRLPNTVNVCFPGLSGTKILEGAPEVWASTGAACHAGSEKASSVLTAMGLDPEVALGAIRLTVGRGTTEEDVDRAVDALIRSVRALRGA